MKKFFSLIAAVLFAGSMFAAVGNLYYTATFLKGTSADGNNVSGYDKTGDYTTNGMTWVIPGNNTNGDYIRVGGKSLDNVDRAITAKSAMESDIAKIVISHNGKSRNEITVNKVTVKVASDADFTQNVITKEYTPAADEIKKSTAGTFVFVPDADKWNTGSYYKFIFTVSNTSTSNGGIDVLSIAFYAYQDASAPAINAEKVDFGLVPTMTLPVEKNANLVVTGANLTEAISYSVLGSNVEVSGSLTTTGGTLDVTLNAGAAGEISDTIVLTSGAIVTKVPVEAVVLNTVGDGSESNPFSVADVVALNNRLPLSEKYWVVGYIVGCAANEGVLAGSDVNSNIALGDAADQAEALVPVELPNNTDYRANLNVIDNPSNKGKLLKVHGQLISYFLTTGVKAIDDYEFVEDGLTAIDNTNAAVKAVKVVRDGVLYIEKNGVLYNAQGAIVR